MSKQKFQIGEKVIVNRKEKGIITDSYSNGERRVYVVEVDHGISGVIKNYKYSYEIKATEKYHEGDRVVLTRTAIDWLKENDIYKYVNDYSAVYVIKELLINDSKTSYIIKNEQTGYVIYSFGFYDDDLELYVEENKAKAPEKHVVKIETALGDVITNDSELIEKLIGKQTDDRITFHEDILPGHSEISDTGAISWVVDWDKLPEPPKKDKPIQMVEFRKQDIVDKEYKNLNKKEYRARLESNWKEICNRYLELFCDKHEWPYEPDMWVGGDIGTIVMIGDMFVSMDNIRYDIDNDVPEEYFTKWYWKSLDVHELTDGAENYMNYENYCKGCPDYWTEERMQSIRESKARIEKAKKALEDEIQNIGKGELF